MSDDLKFAPKDEDEMEDFRDYGDEGDEVDSKLDDYEDDEDDDDDDDDALANWPWPLSCRLRPRSLWWRSSKASSALTPGPKRHRSASR